MEKGICLVVFTLSEQTLALPLSQVEKVIQAVEVTPVSDAPETVLGVINFRGKILPVLDIRKRLGLPARERELSDQFLIVHTPARTLALVADAVLGVIESPEMETAAPEPFLPGLAYIDGAIKWEGKTILVCRLDKLFSSDEDALLNALSNEP